MSKSQSHRRAQGKAAGKSGKTEVSLPHGRVLDAKRGKTATEIERSSGSRALLEQAARRLKAAHTSQHVLQVPQTDMGKAAEAMKKVGVSGTVKNMTGTRRRSVKA